MATKESTGDRAYDKSNESLQSNYVGNSLKSMHLSVKASLKKLKTDYIDLLYVHVSNADAKGFLIHLTRS